MVRTGWTPALTVALLAASSAAALGQAVQLPTFRFFGVRTTVVAPDSGGAYLGGVNRGSYGSASHGPLRNRAIGADRGASHAGVRATIIDLHEWDQAVLAEGAARRRARLGDLADDPRVGYLNRHVARSDLPAASPPPEPPITPGPTIEQLRRRAELARRQRGDEARLYYAKAEQALANGKSGAAKVFLQMAHRRAEGPFKQQIAHRIAALTDGKMVASTETP